MSIFNTHQFIHGCYVKQNQEHDAYVSALRDRTTGEQKLFITRDPEVSFYVTKPQFRNYTEKPEYMKMEHLEQYRTRYIKLGESLAKALGEKTYGKSYFNVRSMLSSNYVFNADISIGTRIKQRFTAVDKKIPKLNVGTLDIETSVLGDKQIILITFINGDGNTYTAALSSFFKHGQKLEDIRKLYFEVVEPELLKKLKPKAKEAYNKAPIQLHLFESDSEAECMKWIFQNIHKHRPDFVVIWNEGYDIPYLLQRAEFRNIDPTELFCHPDVPKDLRFCKFKKDNNSMAAHITDYWDWFYCTGYTQCVDALSLYGRLRKTKGRDASYTLDFIGAKELGTGKLDFGGGQSHAYMQENKFVDYGAYNIVDNVLLHIMNIMNRDIQGMLGLVSHSELEDFSKQTVQLKNLVSRWMLDRGMVLGSVGEALTKEYDVYITNKGGAVLDPTDAVGAGISILIENDKRSTVLKFIADSDATSMYPSGMKVMNCSRETKLATIINVDDSQRIGHVDVEDVILTIPDRKITSYDVTDLFEMAGTPYENAMPIGHKYFNLPSYTEIFHSMKKKGF